MSYDLDAFDQDLFDEIKAVMKDKTDLMIKTYIENARIYIDNIKKAILRSDYEQIATSAHPLKSSSASLGVVSVSLIARDMEGGAKAIDGRQSSLFELQSMVDSIEIALDCAVARLEKNFA